MAYKIPAIFIPNSIVNYYEDFITNENGWSSDHGFEFNQIGTSANPGQVSGVAGGDSGGGYLFVGNPSGLAANPGLPFVLGGGAFDLNIVLNLVALSNVVNDYTMYLGFGNNFPSLILPTDGIWFQYNHAVNGGKWQIITSNSSVKTVHDSGILASTGFHNYGIQVNPDATSVSFTIDKNIVSNIPITTNIPSVDLTFGLIYVLNLGVAPNFLVDLVYYTQTLTTSR